MNTLIANQYGQVQGALTEKGLLLTVDAETPRRESVHLMIPLDSVVGHLYLLSILTAVERRINQFQLNNSPPSDESLQEDEALVTGPPSPDTDLFEPSPASKNSRNKVYGRFPNFLIYEQVEQSRLRVFFAARDEQKRVARFDLNPGEVRAFRALAEHALFSLPRIDLLVRDELSLAVAVTASRKGLVFDVQTPLWQSPFVIGQANNVATLGVFVQRALNGAKTTPIQFETDSAGVLFRKKPDGRVLVEFRHQESSERLTLSRLHLYEMEILARYVLYHCFDSGNGDAGVPARDNAVTSAAT